MCGIVGSILAPGSPSLTPDKRVSAMKRIAHRGPDAQGEFRDDRVWFGHARLSILDLTAAGNQPMRAPDTRHVLCYNGEVYNFAEIAASYRIDGLRSRSDTEVVLRAFTREGPAALSRFNGMFALALYDAERRRVWLARDRLGIKPLYYRQTDRSLDFASELPALLALGETAPACDISTLHEWLYYGTTLGERTLFGGIRKLPPGHYLELNLDDMTAVAREYWSPAHLAGGVKHDGSVGDLAIHTRKLLENAVRRQLVSDVPVGVFLSGGIDSSAITAFASRHYGGALATYSVGFDFDKGVNELPKARRVARQFRTLHHELQVAGADIAETVVTLVEHHGAPFSDAANIPLLLLARQVSPTTKVVLQGDGGDEVFGGYSRYSTLSWLRAARAAAYAGRVANVFTPRGKGHYRRRRYVNALMRRNAPERMALLLTEEDAEFSPTMVFAAGLRGRVAATDPFARYRECQQRVAAEDVVNQMLFVDLMIILPDVFLEKVDRATMAAGLEVRVPFLDNDLVEWALGLSGSQKVSLGRKKWLLKRALDGILPSDILHGPKTGFGVPYGYWISNALRPLFFDNIETFDRRNPRVLERPTIERLFAEHQDGTRDRGFLLWKLMNFTIWSNRFDVRVPA